MSPVEHATSPVEHATSPVEHGCRYFASSETRVVAETLDRCTSIRETRKWLNILTVRHDITNLKVRDTMKRLNVIQFAAT
jgi:hypothetical protein